MNEVWYYMFDGQKAVGPLSLDILVEKIKSGQLGRYQLVFKVGQEEWQPALAFPELLDVFAVTSVTRETQNGWVVMRRTENRVAVDSLGPFSTEEVKERLRDGRLSYIDYAWKEGMHQWRRLSVMKEFAPETKAPIGPPPLVDIPQTHDVLLEEVLRSIEVVRKRFERIQNLELPRPEDAEGEDLAKLELKNVQPGSATPTEPKPVQKLSKPPPRPRPKTVPIGRLTVPKLTAPEPSASTEVKPSAAPTDANPRTAAPVTEGPKEETAAGVVVHPPGEKAPEPAQPARPAAAGAVSTAPGIPTNPGPPPRNFSAPRRAVFYTQWSLIFVLLVGIAIRMSPTLRELVLVNFLGTSPMLLTPAVPPRIAVLPPPVAEATPIPAPVTAPKVAHHAKPAAHPATRLKIRVDHKSSDVPFSIDTDAGPEQIVWIEVVGPPGLVLNQSHYFRRWRWATDKPIEFGEMPAGYYRVHVSTGDLTADERFDVNGHTKTFADKLRQQKKQSSMDFWSERKRLYAVSRKIAKLLSQSRVNQVELAKLARFQPATMIFYDLWTELRDICQTARQGDVATARERIGQFQIKVSQLTLWK